MASQFQLRRGTAAEWTSANPTLAQGEPGYERDTGKWKVGDGTTAWASLAYMASGGGGAPTGNAGGVLAGTYPNPSFAVDMATQAELDAETTTRLNADSALSSNLAGKQATSEKGQVNGYASLDGSGLVPTAQLPPTQSGSGPIMQGDIATNLGATQTVTASGADVRGLTGTLNADLAITWTGGGGGGLLYFLAIQGGAGGWTVSLNGVNVPVSGN